jgi:hypothetical protein
MTFLVAHSRVASFSLAQKSLYVAVHLHLPEKIRDTRAAGFPIKGSYEVVLYTGLDVMLDAKISP